MFTMRKIWIVLGLLLALGAISFWARRNESALRQAKEIEQRAVETRALSFSYRHGRMYQGDPFESSFIGGLVVSGYWRHLRPLAPAQEKVITRLDELIRDATDQTSEAVADYLDTNPADYEEFTARVQARRARTRHHAERMVLTGLLTEPQVAFVMQQYLSSSSGVGRAYVLGDEHVQDLLGLTAAQKKAMVRVGKEEGRQSPSIKETFVVDQQAKDAYKTLQLARMKRMEEGAMNVLTPGQREKWERLTAPHPLPAMPPDLPAIPEAELARFKVESVSPVFRFLAEKGGNLALTEAQKDLLKRLDEITRQGLYWISLRDPQGPPPAAVDRAARTGDEFVKHAELVALSGILTEKQAEMVRAAIPQR